MVSTKRQPQAAIGAAVVALVLWIIWTRFRPTPRPESGSATPTMSPSDPALLAALTSGRTEAVTDLEAGTDDQPGMFTLWIGDNLVYYGRGSGVAGRVRRVTNQPGAPLQRRLAAQHPKLWSARNESSDQKRASEIIKDRGRVRIARFQSSDEAEQALDTVSDELDALIGD
ncbi:MAG: hypothetical protein ACLFRV_07995 [Acidimicrobiales bacterium]